MHLGLSKLLFCGVNERASQRGSAHQAAHTAGMALSDATRRDARYTSDVSAWFRSVAEKIRTNLGDLILNLGNLTTVQVYVCV